MLRYSRSIPILCIFSISITNDSISNFSCSLIITGFLDVQRCILPDKTILMLYTNQYLFQQGEHGKQGDGTFNGLIFFLHFTKSKLMHLQCIKRIRINRARLHIKLFIFTKTFFVISFFGTFTSE